MIYGHKPNFRYKNMNSSQVIGAQLETISSITYLAKFCKKKNLIQATKYPLFYFTTIIVLHWNRKSRIKSQCFRKGI